MDDVDFSAVQTLRFLYDILKENGVRHLFAELTDEIKAQLNRNELTGLMGEDAFYSKLADVLSAYRQQTGAIAEPK